MMFLILAGVCYMIVGYIFAWSLWYLHHIPRTDVHVVAMSWPPYVVMFIRGEYQ